MNRPPKILAIQPEPWYMNIYYENLARYLADEFIIDVGPVSYPPFGQAYLDRFPAEVLGLKNPDDYDLLVPVWPGHWSVDKETYRHKMAPVLGMIGESETNGVAVIGSATPFIDRFLKGKKFHKLRFGIDTELFKPFKKVREDNLLHVGLVGTLHSPRRGLKGVFSFIKDIPGVKIMYCPAQMVRSLGDLEEMGGWDARECIFAAAKEWATLPNIYNQFDVLLRVDQDPGVSFPVLEAASCGVPVIATHGGIDHYFTKECGGGILLEAPDEALNSDGTGRNWYIDHPEWVGEKTREAIIWMRDNPTKRKAMAKKIRQEAVDNWDWKKLSPAWRKFFRAGVKQAKAPTRGAF